MGKNIKILDRQSYSEGTNIIEQGTEGSRAYIIESGRVEVFRRDPEGNIIKISELGPGALIGEIALIDNGIRTASVKTLEATILISIAIHDFHKALKKSNNLKNNLTKTISKRVQETLSAIENHRHPDNIRQQEVKEEVASTIAKLESTLERISEKVKN